MRRWKAGDWLELGGMRFRVVEGRKALGDLRLEWETPRGWTAVPMSVGAMLADFFWDNEEHLYPQANGYLGGNKFLRYQKHGALHGWEKADAGLQAEKAARPSLWIEVAKTEKRS